MFVRIGNDISVQWAITHNGIPESLEGRKLNLQHLSSNDLHRNLHG